MASKLLCVLCLGVVSLQASTIRVSNLTGASADLGPIFVPEGPSQVYWPGSWGDCVFTWGTNMANLGTNGTFEVTVTATGLGVVERYSPEAAFGAGVSLAIAQGLLGAILFGIVRRMHPGRAATPEL